MRQSFRIAWSNVSRPLRFGKALESEFRSDFDRLGRGARSELWLVMLVIIAIALICNKLLFDVPPEVMPLGRVLVLAVLVPMVLRWLSGSRSPLRRWSALLFIASVYIDIGAMMALRIACLEEGIDVVPLVMPVAVLMSLIVVQIRFVLVAPAMLLGLAGIVGAELWAFDANSNRLFAIAASTAMATVALSAAYDLERWTRIGWLRQRELDVLARTDPLTGLANRRHFEEVVRGAVERDGAISLMILDIDRFKSFNDTFGHPTGDRCLRAVGDYLASAVGADGFAARLGGEEFAAVWIDSGDAGHAEDLRRGVATVVVEPAPGTVSTITASAGFARSERGADPEVVVGELLSRADTALYEAKRSGRDMLVEFTGSDLRRSRDRRGPGRDTRTGSAAGDALAGSLRFEPHAEAEFRASFEAQGRSSRRLIMIGLLGVIVVLLLFQVPLLKIPPEADRLGRLTLIFGLGPGVLIALAGCSWPRLFRWSPKLYIAGVAVIVTAQMVERAIQLPQGYDVVPLIMPLSVVLSLTVVQIRFTLLAPAAVTGLVGICAAELALFPTTGNRLLEIAACVVMIGVTLRFSYKLERSRRVGWRAERRLAELARIDSLTGLVNRRQFDTSLREIAMLSAQLSRPIVLAVIDIDHFKSYNDALGHLAGDECLRTIGQYLAAAAAERGGFGARLGGEEFAIAWLDAYGDSAAQADTVRSGISGLPIQRIPDGGPVTASAGIVVAVPHDDTATFVLELQHRADAALYDAKHAGRNRSIVIDLQRVE